MINPCKECLVTMMCLETCDAFFQYMLKSITDLVQIPKITDYIHINHACDVIRKNFLGYPAPVALGWGLLGRDSHIGVEVSINSKTKTVIISKFGKGITDESKSV